ncbi:hypothetical protein RND81_14G005600 [Saponaria officinalis]|uniref:C3H1-type domain-containing protein n=1 Tax=Saponaria officinalis TaxID=3572 RepID=A0AAW1GSN6_SAPOF
MPYNSENHSNAASISSNEIQDGMSRMKIEKKEEDEEAKEYPNRPGEPDCLFYTQNKYCGYGANCRFNHPPLLSQTDESKSELPQREGQPDCRFYMKTGNCKYGSMCKYHHPLDRRNAEDVTLNSLGLPLRQQEKACPFYLHYRKCKFGAACKFDHPEPASLDTALAVSGTGPPLPSTSIPCFGAHPTWSWSSPSGFLGPQAYMPYFFPAMQNWNGYLGNMTSVAAAPNALGTHLAYTSKNPGEPISGRQANMFTMTISNLPQRPDQPECRFFMSNEGCKRGLSCKFHHPKEKIAQNLGPHGLPLRPGESICTHFSSYGICIYGPTCKFNHPVTGYIPGYYFNMPFIPGATLPFFPTPKNLPVSSLTETSQSKTLKITEWIQKPDTVEGKDPQPSTTKPAEEKADVPSNAETVATAEIAPDQSN